MPHDKPKLSKPLRIGFAGTPVFAATALQALLDAQFEVVLVLSQPDRPSGRGMKRTPSPVKQLALKHELPVFQPERLKGQDPAGQADEVLRQLKTGAGGEPLDFLVVAAYGLILPQAVLDAPRFGCLNIHASLLPRWRGAAPVQRAIEAGDQETGICIMQMEAGLDTGPVRLTRRVKIAPNATSTTLHDTLADLGGKAIVQSLHDFAEGVLPIEQQSEVGITYAQKILKPEGLIDWSQSALVIDRKIRAFDPFPGCVAFLNGQIIKCFESEVGADAPVDQPAGTIVATDEQGVWVQTGRGCVRIKTMQKPGAKHAPAQQVIESLGLEPGATFGVQPAAS